MEEKIPKNKSEKQIKTKENQKALFNGTSIPHVLKVSLGKVICPNPNTVESSIVHSC